MNFYRGKRVFRADLGVWTRFVAWAPQFDPGLMDDERPVRIALVESPDVAGVYERVSEHDLHDRETRPEDLEKETNEARSCFVCAEYPCDRVIEFDLQYSDHPNWKVPHHACMEDLARNCGQWRNG